MSLAVYIDQLLTKLIYAMGLILIWVSLSLHALKRDTTATTNFVSAMGADRPELAGWDVVPSVKRARYDVPPALLAQQEITKP